MFLSREIDIKLCKINTKIFIYKVLYITRRFKRIILIKYATNLKTTISQRSLRNLGLLLLLVEFNNFSFLIDIIDHIIYMSVLCDQSSHQYQCSIIITCPRLYHVTQFYINFSRRVHTIELSWVSINS